LHEQTNTRLETKILEAREVATKKVLEEEEGLREEDVRVEVERGSGTGATGRGAGAGAGVGRVEMGWMPPQFPVMPPFQVLTQFFNCYAKWY
jgi:hypothetical protein